MPKTAVVLLSLCLVALANPVAVDGVDVDLGPFRVANRRFTVRLHEKRIAGAGVRDPEWQTTLAGIELRDEKGSVHYRESFPYEISGSQFSETLSAAAGLLQGRERSGLGGQSWQVFGLFGDRLVPFCRPISVEGDLIQKSDGNVVGTASEPGLRGDVLHFRVWTGNFFVVYPVRADFQMARAMPAWRCSGGTAEGIHARCRYRVETERLPQSAELDGNPGARRTSRDHDTSP